PKESLISFAPKMWLVRMSRDVTEQLGQATLSVVKPLCQTFHRVRNTGCGIPQGKDQAWVLSRRVWPWDPAAEMQGRGPRGQRPACHLRQKQTACEGVSASRP